MEYVTSHERYTQAKEQIAPKLGPLIRACRQEAKLSQRRLAQLTNIDHTYLSKAENGQVQMAPCTLRRIVEVCDRQMEEAESK